MDASGRQPASGGRTLAKLDPPYEARAEFSAEKGGDGSGGWLSGGWAPASPLSNTQNTT